MEAKAKIIELKHIAPYLPYGVTVYGSSELWKLFGIDKVVNGEIFVNLENGNENTTMNYYRSASMYEHSLVLRPMSYLTKEIEVNGERFVPIVELAKISNLNLKHELIDSISIEEDVAVLKYGALQFGFDLTDMSFITCLGEEIVPAYNQLQLFERLFSCHFDVYNLIENGLAIDINTLKK